MRALSLLLLAAFPAAAQAPPSTLYDRAPWWMREPVLPSLGEVRTELPPNRVTFGGAFESIDRTVAEATAQSAAKVRGLAEALASVAGDKARVTTRFFIRPIYAQYKDKEGVVQNNERPDKVDRYSVSASVEIELRDFRLAPRAFAVLVASKPTSTQSLFFRLEPDNAVKTELFRLAVADAKRRATEAPMETGARLGAVKLIDPTGRACSTDVLLAGAPRTYGVGDYTDVVVTGSRRNAYSPAPLDVPEPPALHIPAIPPPPAPPPPPPPGGGVAIAAEAAALNLPLQPPLQTLTRQVCVVYALGGASAAGG